MEEKKAGDGERKRENEREGERRRGMERDNERGGETGRGMERERRREINTSLPCRLTFIYKHEDESDRRSQPYKNDHGDENAR